MTRPLVRALTRAESARGNAFHCVLRSQPSALAQFNPSTALLHQLPIATVDAASASSDPSVAVRRKSDAIATVHTHCVGYLLNDKTITVVFMDAPLASAAATVTATAAVTGSGRMDSTDDVEMGGVGAGAGGGGGGARDDVAMYAADHSQD
jgi:hypothetical protein